MKVSDRIWELSNCLIKTPNPATVTGEVSVKDVIDASRVAFYRGFKCDTGKLNGKEKHDHQISV